VIVDSVSRCAALSWARGRELTPQRLWPALRARGGLEALLASGEDDLASDLGSRELARVVLRGPDDAEALRLAADVERTGVRLVTAFDAEYPEALRQIADPPFLLHALGRIERLRLPAVAIVGSRDASRYGRDVAWRLAQELSAAGLTVVSGFARGVDAAAHEAALGGPGGTIAVLGCGLDVDYPREHRKLKERISADHLLVSEYPLGAEPRPQNFPIRNRIIAGLSAGVVVVEASRRSGSLITARLANDFGRDVFAVPGSIFSQTSTGAHELLRDGAILCRGAEDVLAELFPSVGTPRLAAAVSPFPAAELSPESRRIFEALGREESLSAEELSRSLDLPAATVLASLFELEGAGIAVPVAGGRYGVPRR
jgi:DNA processing protein